MWQSWCHFISNSLSFVPPCKHRQKRRDKMKDVFAEGKSKKKIPLLLPIQFRVSSSPEDIRKRTKDLGKRRGKLRKLNRIIKEHEPTRRETSKNNIFSTFACLLAISDNDAFPLKEAAWQIYEVNHIQKAQSAEGRREGVLSRHYGREGGTDDVSLCQVFTTPIQHCMHACMQFHFSCLRPVQFPASWAATNFA